MPGEKGEEPAEKPTASNPAGKALAAKMVAAIGSEAKLNAIKSVHSESNMVRKMPQGDLPLTVQSTIVFPDRLQAVMQGPMGNISFVATPKAGFMAIGNGETRDMPPEQKSDMLMQIKRDPIYIAQHLNDPAFIFAANGSEKIEGVDAQILDISGEGMSMRCFIDPQNGRILRETYPTVSQSGPAQGQTDLEDWQTSDGITLPRVRKIKQNGQDYSSVQVNKIEINPAVDLKLFDKPAQ